MKTMRRQADPSIYVPAFNGLEPFEDEPIEADDGAYSGDDPIGTEDE